MGSYASKLFARYGDEVNEPKAKLRYQEEVAPFTPVDTKKTLRADPRSASAGIPRTPIEVNFTPPNTTRRPINAIPSYLQKKPYLETDLDNISYLAPKKGTPRQAFGADTLDSNISKLSQFIRRIYRTKLKGLGGSQALYNVKSFQKHLRLRDIHGHSFGKHTFKHTAQQFDVPAIDVTDQSSPVLPNHEAGDTPVAELRYKILGIDPRSPAADFDRTPILTSRSMIRMRARSQENLARRDSLAELGIGNPARLSYCETMTVENIPEVLALPDIMLNLNKAKNMDVTMDTSDQYDSCTSSSDESVETISDESREEITVVLNPKIKATQEATASSFGSSIEKIEDTFPADNVDRVLSIAARAGDKREQAAELDKKITVWRDSVTPEITDTLDADIESELNTMPNEEVIIEFDDTEITKTLKIQSIDKQDGKEDNKTKKLEFGERKNKNIESEGKIFFQEKIFANDAKNVGQAPKVRTPLGNRSNNHSKIGNGMPMKSPQQLLRGRAMSTKFHQENTPPRSMKTNNKHNGTQWDPDSTVLI